MNDTATATSPADLFGEVIRDAWKQLADDRGARAALRRCGSVLEIQLEPIFHRIARRLPWVRHDRLAVIVGLLADIDEDANERNFAAVLARSKGDRAIFGGLRFRRLVAVTEADELLTYLRRALRIAGRSAPVASLARDVSYWNDRTLREWAATYYGAAPTED